MTTPLSKYTWDDVVTVHLLAPSETRPGAKAWVVGVSLPKDRTGAYLAQFPDGVVYTIEFEDGSDANAREDWLEPFAEEDGSTGRMPTKGL